MTAIHLFIVCKNEQSSYPPVFIAFSMVNVLTRAARPFSRLRTLPRDRKRGAPRVPLRVCNRDPDLRKWKSGHRYVHVKFSFE